MEWFVEDPQRGQIALTTIALVVAIAGLWFGRKNLPVTGFVVFVFLLYAAMAIPSAIPVRTVSQRNACKANLRQIQDAKIRWAGENNKLATDIPNDTDLCGTNGIDGVLHRFPACPRGGTYTIGAMGQNPTCTFSNKGHHL